MYSLTIFKNIFDNKIEKSMDFHSWDSFENLLYKLSDLPAYKAKKGESGGAKKSSPLISPATYTKNSRRNNESVIAWGGWAALDIDDHEIQGDLEQELFDKFGHYYYVCYSTASSTKEHPKFRLVFPLTKSVPSKDIKHFWFALNTEFSGLGDPQTKDFSRMYYVPGQYPGAHNFIFTNDKGKFINPMEMMESVTYIYQGASNNFLDMLPKGLQEEVIAHRKSKLDNKHKYKWSGIDDCPFVSKRILQEYVRITGTGWYHKMYQMMVSIAFSAIRKEYPITALEIETLMREFDSRTGGWYKNRPIIKEANSALNYAYKNSDIG